MRLIKIIAVSSFLMCTSSAWATLQGFGGTITNLRIEGGVGLIGFSGEMPNCGPRLWVDMSSAAGRAAYSTAVLAFAMNKPIYIRGDDQAGRNFGACALYDIYVSQ